MRSARGVRSALSLIAAPCLALAVVHHRIPLPVVRVVEVLDGHDRNDAAGVVDVLDADLGETEVALGLYHTERKQTIIARGIVDPAWVAHLGKEPEATFIAGSHLVTIVRSRQTLVAAIASVPITHVERRAEAIAWRLVPACRAEPDRL